MLLSPAEAKESAIVFGCFPKRIVLLLRPPEVETQMCLCHVTVARTLSSLIGTVFEILQAASKGGGSEWPEGASRC